MSKILKKVALVIAVTLLSTTFVGCSNSSKNTTETESTVSKIAGTEMAGSFGQETINENIGITLKNVYKLDMPEQDGNIFIAFNLQIVNKSDENQEFDAIRDFCIMFNGDSELHYDELIQPNALVYIKQNTNFNRISGEVAPNTMLEGVVTAMVPKDFKEATLVCYVNYTTTTGSIDFTVTPDMLEDCPTNS
jgi:hypothetical protein